MIDYYDVTLLLTMSRRRWELARVTILEIRIFCDLEQHEQGSLNPKVLQEGNVYTGINDSAFYINILS